MRSNDEIPWWLRADLEIIGFEDKEDEDEEEDETEEEEDESEEDEDEDSDDEDEDDEESEEEDDKSKSQKGKKKPAKRENISGLKSALRRERIKNRDLERRLRKLEKQPPPKKEDKGKPKGDEDDSDESQVSKAQQQREDRLAKQLKTTAVDAVIVQHAGDFQDVKDALQLISRREIEVDQDDDDPSEIEVDEESVIDAVKALAKKKPWLLKPKNQRQSRSGSKFNGRKKKSSEPNDEEIRKKYSALQRY